MNDHTLRARLNATLTIAVLAASAAASDVPPEDPAEMQRMMDLWKEISAPNEHHHRLEAFAGDWTFAGHVWLGGPGVAPVALRGRETIQMTLGGRFLELSGRGTSLGVPFESHGYVGYDNYKKKYVLVYADTGSTGFMIGMGSADATGRIITFYGSADEWLSGEHDKPYKHVMRLVDDDTFTFEIHDLSFGPGDTKIWEQVYSRRAAAPTAPAAPSAHGGDEAPAPTAPPVEMLDLWKKVSTPGDRHAVLDYFVGDWNLTMRTWMAGPGAPPVESPGQTTFRWVLGGRFLKMESSGLMFGIPYVGHSMVGYDNFKSKYVAASLDSNNTAIYTAEGLLDRTGKVITFYGAMDEWMTDEHDKTVMYRHRIIDENTFVFEVHDMGIVPGETKVIEMRYVRRAVGSR